MKATALNYTTAEINRNYRIKVSGIDNNGNKIHKLVGVSKDRDIPERHR